MKLSFRIRRIYFDLIKNGQKDNEIRASKPFWDTRAKKAQQELKDYKPVEAVLVCGKEIIRKKVDAITYHETSEGALNREPSEQGMKDIGSGPVWKFHFHKCTDFNEAGKCLWCMKLHDCYPDIPVEGVEE